MPDSVTINRHTFEVDLTNPIDIAIPLRFNGPQPNAYGVEPAASSACEYGELIGDTRRGGSCNFERISLIPHCNGTHTECVGHITNERISVSDCLKEVLIPALLVSVMPETGDDALITRRTLENGGVLQSADALIIRTLPNDDTKLTQSYGAEPLPPYFSTDAMEYIVQAGFTHLLVDMPSIDRMFDDGKLANHRIFWNVEHGSFETNPATRIKSTITELIFVPNHIPDGEYLLNLQIAPFESDAVPSRPVLFKTA